MTPLENARNKVRYFQDLYDRQMALAAEYGKGGLELYAEALDNIAAAIRTWQATVDLLERKERRP